MKCDIVEFGLSRQSRVEASDKTIEFKRYEQRFGGYGNAKD
jgi:hypothetical protein